MADADGSGTISRAEMLRSVRAQEGDKDKNDQRTIIWCRSCLVASDAVQEYTKKVLPGPEVTRCFERFYSGAFDRFLEPKLGLNGTNMGSKILQKSIQNLIDFCDRFLDAILIPK